MKTIYKDIYQTSCFLLSEQEENDLQRQNMKINTDNKTINEKICPNCKKPNIYDCLVDDGGSTECNNCGAFYHYHIDGSYKIGDMCPDFCHDKIYIPPRDYSILSSDRVGIYYPANY